MVTIKDVARMAGVSPSTVSKVLNGYTDISPETRENVLRVIEETQFIPNTSAQRLVQKKSRTIGFIMSGVEATNPNDVMPMQLLKGTLLCVQSTSYDLVFFPTTSRIQQERSYDQICRENNIAGVILSGLQNDDRYYQEAGASDLPCVTIDFSLEGKRSASVLIDNLEAARCAVDYLIDQNHREIGIVGGKENTAVGLERYCGYCQSLIDHAIPLNRDYVVRGEFNESIAYEQTKALLQRQPQITALFCASDIMALGVYHAAEELGKRIPEDLSIVAFDDFPLAPYVHPALTTVRQHFDSVGSKAVKLLIALIEKDSRMTGPVYSTYELILRDSVRRLAR